MSLTTVCACVCACFFFQWRPTSGRRFETRSITGFPQSRSARAKERNRAKRRSESTAHQYGPLSRFGWCVITFCFLPVDFRFPVFRNVPLVKCPLKCLLVYELGYWLCRKLHKHALVPRFWGVVLLHLILWGSIDDTSLGTMGM